MLFNKSIKALSIGFVAFASVACSGGLTDEQKAGAEAQAEFLCQANSPMAVNMLKMVVANDDGSTEVKIARETLKIMKENGC